MSISLFIDGGHGTTGLEIRERLAARDDIRLLDLDERDRRNEGARRDALHAADFAILCLPDDAARDAVALAGDSPVRIIDASTAHRTDPDWVYGFAEIAPDRPDHIANATRVSNPGCYAVTFVALVGPLVRSGLLPPDTRLSVNGVSGYSGGGRAMIEEFESGAANTAFRNYALGLAHKHLPEMRTHAGLAAAPLFSPSVANVHRGMIVEVSLSAASLSPGASAENVRAALAAAYPGGTTIKVLDTPATEALTTLAIERCANTDRLDILVFASPDGEWIRLCGVLDNLGKGAAGQAVQNLNLMAGFDMLSGLRV